MNKNFFRQYNKLILGSIILFFTALLFNHWTPYAADDYSYMFNLSDGSRMTSIGQIFSSLAVHYTKYGNGRLVSHFFCYAFSDWFQVDFQSRECISFCVAYIKHLSFDLS